MKLQGMVSNARRYVVPVVLLTVVMGIVVISTFPALALPRIYIHTRMENPPEGETIITHLLISGQPGLSTHAEKIRASLPPIECVYPHGADIAYTGTIYPFDNKEIWFNRDRTIAALNMKPVVDICDLYLVLSTKGGLLVMPDCDARVGAVCRAQNKHYELGWLRIDFIKGRIITVESEKASISSKITHVRLLVSEDGQFRLLRYWRTRSHE